MQLTTLQLDILQELINIGVGKAAGVMNEMLHSPLELSVPRVVIVDPDHLDTLGKTSCATVCQGFKGQFNGTAALVFPPESASTLVAALTGEEAHGLDLDELRTGTLTEVGNIVLNGVMGAIANTLKEHIEYNVPSFQECSLEELLKIQVEDEKKVCLLAETSFRTKDLELEGSVYILFEVGSFNILLEAINALVPTG
ncbi:MAG: chemotaxis protein CheX [Nitrospirales bacterium]